MMFPTTKFARCCGAVSLLVLALTVAAGPAAAQWTDATTPVLADILPSHGVSWADFDLDGDLDIYLANNGNNKLFRNGGEDPGNPGQWLWDNVAPTNGTGIGSNQVSSVGVWGDYDNDGDPDLYLSNTQGANHLFRNDPVNPGLPIDHNRVFVDVTNSLILGSTRATQSVAWVDYDNDGDLDLYQADPVTNYLLRNDGADPQVPGFTTFTNVTAATGTTDTYDSYGVAWADYDKDGDQDLYIANYNGPSKMLRNDPQTPGDPDDPDRVFVNVTAAAGLTFTGPSRGASWGDFDNDGDMDLYVTNYGTANRLYRNNGGVFQSIGAAAGVADTGNGRHCCWVDYDNDADLDLWVTNYDNGIVTNDSRLYRNDGPDGSNPNGWLFVNAAGTLLANNLGLGSSAGWADYDDDGDLDMYFVNWNADHPNKLVRNDLASGADYLHLDLVGRLSNASAIGARVRVVTGTSTQIREVNGGEGYHGQNSLRAEFGLGMSAVIDSVIVRWPSGVVQELGALMPNQVFTVVETGPDSPVMVAEPAYTSGTTNTVSWSDESGSGAVAYRVQAALDTGFTTLVGDSGWIAGLSHEFTGLSDGQLVRFRVRARDAGGIASRWSGSVGSLQDNAPPVSSINALASPQQDVPFGVAYLATDTGSGVASVALYYRVDPGAWTLFGSRADGQPIVFTSPEGPATYELYTLATDNIGNLEAAPPIADETVVVEPAHWVNVAPADGSGVGNNGNGRGAAWGDYDGDGLYDLFITNRPVWFLPNDDTDHLYHNLGPDLGNPDSWLFQDVTTGAMADPAYGQGISWGDFDGDGDLDVYQSNMAVGGPAPNHLWRNNGNGSFTDIAPQTGTTDPAGSGRAACWVDFDLDGDLDLYLCNDGPNYLWRNDGEDPLNPGQWLFVNVAPTDGTGIGDDMYTMGCSWIDYDNDGDPDLHLANYNNGPDRLFRNDGEDLQNPGQWVFTNVAALMGLEDTGNGMNASWGDYDNDGWLDLYLANDGPNRLYHRVPGVNHFEDVTAVSGAGLAGNAYTAGTGWADYDNDGDLDLYVGNHWTDATGDWVPNQLFRNDGEDPLNPGRWVFTNAAPASGAGIGAGENTTATAWADYDNDGDLDIYLCNMSGTPNFLFRNDVPDAQTNHWLQLDLVSLSANTSAIGARVRCVVGGTSMLREVEGITGFLSQNSLTVEFGLGAATAADSILIRWPSGIEQNLANVPADQRLEVIESGPGRPVLAALPAITVGDSLVLAWSPVTGSAPVTYEAELSADAAFTQVLAGSGWITETSYTFIGLADAFTGFYRVRSRDAERLISLWSNTVTTTQDASPPASSVDPVVIAFQGLPFEVTATATDAVSGVARVDLWYRHGDDQGPFTLYGSHTDGSPFFFELPDSLGVYYFYTTSADSAGNEEPAPAGWDRTVTVTQPQWVLVSPTDGSGVGNNGNGRGAAWGDYDQDGDHDLFITNRIVYQNSADATSHLFRNDGAVPGEHDNWLFADVSVPPMTTEGYGQGVAWGDFDGDGDLDLYQTYMQVNENSPAPNRLYRNDGGGAFTEIGLEAGVNDGGSGRSCAWADYDQDGDLDLYLCNNGANRLYRNDGFDPETRALWVFTNVAPADSTGIGDGSYTMGCAWGDFDNDGDPDLYLANYNSQPDRLFRNDGADPQNPGEWLFTDIAAEVGMADTGSGLGCTWGDFDNDGLLDLYVSNDGPNFLYHNVSAGLMTGKLGRRAQDAADNAAEKAAPTIQFTDIAPLYDVGLDDGLYGAGIGWADYDNDGDLDLYLGNHWNANGDPAPNRLFRNEGPDPEHTQGWLFTNAAPTHLGLNIADDSSTNGVAWADYDGDGDLDLYMASMMGRNNKLFRNDVADSTGNHWLQLDLSAPYLNTYAIGARVRCVAGGKSMLRDVDGGSGFLSQGSLTLEFGLGAAAVADTVEILWPDGYHHLMLNVPGDQRLLITQPVTAVGDDGPAPTPLAFRVYDNFPNPFNPSTTIRLDLPTPQRVRLGIYAVDGSLVRRLFDEELPAGTHQAVWDGRNRNGGRVASGVYFYRVETPGDVVTRKMLLVK